MHTPPHLSTTTGKKNKNQTTPIKPFKSPYLIVRYPAFDSRFLKYQYLISLEIRKYDCV